MNSFFLYLTLLTSIFLALPGFSQGRLNESKEEIKKEKAEPTQQSSTEPNPEYEDDGSRSNFLNTILLPYYVLKYTKLALFGKYKSEIHLHNNLSYFPYFDGENGNYIKENTDINDEPKLGRIDLADNILYSDALYGNHLKAKLRPSKYFYFQVDYFLLLEKKKDEKGFDNLNFYNFNFCYDRLRFNKFNLGWMLGANYVASGVEKAGFTYGLNAEVFLRQNISLFGAYKGSKINGSNFNELEITGKYHVQRFHFSPGYEMIQIGSSYFHFLALGVGAYF